MANESQTVYLVETGCYSDRSVAGIFSTRESAEEWITGRGYSLTADWDKAADITEMVIDEERLVLHNWVCVLSLETGDQVICEQRPEDKHYAADAKLDRWRTTVSAWGQSEEHARKNAADARGQKRYELELELQAKENRNKRIAQQFEDMETSRFIENRNKAMIAGGLMKPGSVEVLDEPFVPPTQDQKAMMDPFYDRWVAGVTK